MANFKRRYQANRVKIMPIGYDDIVVPTSYDGKKAWNAREQRFEASSSDRLKDMEDNEHGT